MVKKFMWFFLIVNLLYGISCVASEYGSPNSYGPNNGRNDGIDVQIDTHEVYENNDGLTNEHRVKCFQKYGVEDKEPPINTNTQLDGKIAFAQYVCASTCFDHRESNKNHLHYLLSKIRLDEIHLDLLCPSLTASELKFKHEHCKHVRDSLAIPEEQKGSCKLYCLSPVLYLTTVNEHGYGHGHGHSTLTDRPCYIESNASRIVWPSTIIFILCIYAVFRV